MAVPEALRGPLRIEAKLNYRKFDQFLLNFAFGEDSGLTSTVTVMSEAHAEVALVGRGG